MRQRYVVAWVVLFVAINAAAVWYLRDRMSDPPVPAGSSTRPAPATTQPDDAPSDDGGPISGPVLLGGAEDGSVLRLTRGDCVVGTNATAWVSPDREPPAEVEIPGLVEALAVGRTGEGWRLIGADADCEVTAWSSDSLAGDRWRSVEVAREAWYLDPEVATRVVSPKGVVPLPDDCAATGLQEVRLQVYVVCADGRALVAERATREFTQLVDAVQVEALAVDAAGSQAQLTSVPQCVAGLRVARGRRILDEHCFGNDRAPLGIVWTGDTLVAQIGYELVDNAGGEWAARG